MGNDDVYLKRQNRDLRVRAALYGADTSYQVGLEIVEGIGKDAEALESAVEPDNEEESPSH